MATLELLHKIVTVENRLGIYRNFMMLDRKGKRLAIARSVFLFLLYLIAYTEVFISTNRNAGSNKLVIVFLNIYVIMSTVNSLIPISIAIVQSQSFRTLVANIIKIHEYCHGCVIYQRRQDNLKKRVLALMALYIVGYTLSFVINATQWAIIFKDESVYATVSGIFQSILTNWKDFNFQIEFLILHAFIRIIITSLRHLHTNLLRLLRTVNELKDGVDNLTSLRFQRDIENWASAYYRLALCSDGLEKCFGIQIMFSLFVLVIYFIGLSYDWVATLASKSPGSVGLAVALLINYTSAMSMLLYSGQWAKNEGDHLYRLMAKLYNDSLAIPGSNASELRRSVKALFRQMAVQPIKIKILSTTNLEMSLLLAVFSTVVSYTIVMLQFNHVV